MNGRHGPSIYCATDKNVYDAFQNNKLTEKELRHLLMDRGIVVSPSSSRDYMANLMSMLPFDYISHMKISHKLEAGSIKDSLTNVRVIVDLSNEDLVSIFNEYKRNNAKEGESCKVTVDGDSIRMELKYTEVDFTKTELAQRSLKTAYVELENSSGELIIRHSDTEKGQKICSRIVSDISARVNGNMDRQEISLRAFESPEARTYFFEQLCNYISGYDLDDVTGVDVHRSLIRPAPDVDGDVDVQSYIDKARLKGKGVLSSVEFEQLNQLGFYIYYLNWTVVPRNGVGDKVEFEAKFRDSDKCQHFVYYIKGIYNYRNGSHNKGHRPAKNEDRKEYIPLVEESARKAYQSVIKNYGDIDNEG